MKLSDIAAFWKRLGPALKIALVVVIIVLLGFASCRIIRGSVNSRIAKVEARLVAAQEATKIANAKFKLATERLNIVHAQSEAAKIEADKKLADLARANAKINSDLAAERAKTKQLSNDALAVSLGTYIGAAEIYATAAGSFSLTRMGAENTRGIFLETSALAGKLTNCDAAREQDAIKLQACTNDLGATTNSLGACVAARATDKEVIELLNKDLALWKSKARWAQWKGALKGGSAVAVLAGVAYVLLKK